MDTRDISQALSKPNWMHLDTGSFNDIFISTNPEEGIYWVRKYPREDGTDLDFALSHPKRVTAIWKKINPDLPVQLDESGGWQIPYIAGTKPTDAEVAKTLLDIYQKTKYIIIDGANSDNLIKRPDGRVVCVDLDLAYHAEDPISQEYIKAYVFNQQRNQLTPRYANYFKNKTDQGKGQSVAVIKYLFLVDFGIIKDDNMTVESIIKKYRTSFDKTEEKHEEYKESKNDLYATSQAIFLKLYREEQCWREFPRVKGKQHPELRDIALHAQQDKTFFGRETRSCDLMKRMGWLNHKKEVIQHSGLDEALQTLPTTEREGIKFEPS